MKITELIDRQRQILADPTPVDWEALERLGRTITMPSYIPEVAEPPSEYERIVRDGVIMQLMEPKSKVYRNAKRRYERALKRLKEKDGGRELD